MSAPLAAHRLRHSHHCILRIPCPAATVRAVNTHELSAIHQALVRITDTVGMLTFPRCDLDDVFGLVERIETELKSEHPDTRMIASVLGSIAHSLRAQPEAREACLRIEDVIEYTGADGTSQPGSPPR